MPTTYVALLRGGNVGGKNRLPMKELVQLFADAGCDKIRSYIQSGNVVFQADEKAAAALPDRLGTAIAQRYGFQAPLTLRSAEEMGGIIRNNPFLQVGAPEDTLHVMFLAAVPDPAQVASLDENRSRPDAFAVRGREVYLWLPDGVARTKLTNDYFDSKLAIISTGRNWKTVLKLCDMMGR